MDAEKAEHLARAKVRRKLKWADGMQFETSVVREGVDWVVSGVALTVDWREDLRNVPFRCRVVRGFLRWGVRGLVVGARPTASA